MPWDRSVSPRGAGPPGNAGGVVVSGPAAPVARVDSIRTGSGLPLADFCADLATRSMSRTCLSDSPNRVLS